MAHASCPGLPGRAPAAGNSTKARPDTLCLGASTRINMYIQLGRLMLRTIFSVVDELDIQSRRCGVCAWGGLARGCTGPFESCWLPVHSEP